MTLTVPEPWVGADVEAPADEAVGAAVGDAAGFAAWQATSALAPKIRQPVVARPSKARRVS